MRFAPHAAAGPARRRRTSRWPPRSTVSRATISRPRSSRARRQDDDQPAHAAPRRRRRLSRVRAAARQPHLRSMAQAPTRTSTRRRSQRARRLAAASRARTPRSASGSGRYDGVTDEMWTPIIFARTLLALIQLPPAGFWDDARRASSSSTHARARARRTPRRSCCPLPRGLRAGEPARRRRLGRRRPARLRRGLRSASTPSPFATSTAPSCTTSPARPLPPAETPLPPRFLAPWDQPLLAYVQRDRIIPPELLPLKLTLSGDPTVTVDGRVAASWAIEREGDTARLTISPHVEIRPLPR